METNVSIKSYGDYSSSNYGAHSLEVTVGNLTLLFSYRTVVAFETQNTGLVISENVWGKTTGKHLNWINPDKSKRIPNDQFEAKLAQVLKEHSLTV